MRTKTSSLLLFALSALILFSCRRDLKLAAWDVDVIAPLASGQVDLANLVESDRLATDNSGLYHLVSNDTLFRIGLDTLIGIPDTTISNEFVVPVGSITIPQGVVFYRDTNRISYKLKDIGLTFAEIRESLISVDLLNTIDEKILFRYSILSATLDGDTFRVEELIDANDNFETEFNLDGYDIDFTGLNGDKVNTLITTVEIMIDPNAASPHTFQAGDKFALDIIFRKIVPEYTRGYFGQQQSLFSDSTEIDLFSSIDFEMLDLTEFEVRMMVDNGVGTDLQLSLDRIGSYNSESNVGVNLNHSVVGTNLQFSRAIDLHPSQNDVKHTQKEFVFDEDNSNLDELLELKPDNLIFDLDLEINPLGNVSLGNDFVYYGHDLGAYLSVDVPLKVGVRGLVLSDTFDFNIADSGDNVQFDPLNEGRLILYLNNGFPIEGTVQLILLDEDDIILDSLFDAPAAIQSGIPVQGSATVSSTESVIEIGVSQAKLESLNETRRVLLKSILGTNEGEVTSIYDNGTISFKLLADVNLNTQ